jgi:hypothetical protein
VDDSSADARDVSADFGARIRSVRSRVPAIVGCFALGVLTILVFRRSAASMFGAALALASLGYAIYVRSTFLRCPACQDPNIEGFTATCRRCGARLFAPKYGG